MNINHIFPVPIFSFRFDDAMNFQKQIMPIFYDIERKDNNPFDYCDTGYTSYPKIDQILNMPECNKLRNFIGYSTLQSHEHIGLTENIFISSSWFSINRKHSYHTKHNHLPWVWSGVYYVQCDPLEDAEICFYNKNLESNWPYTKTDSKHDLKTSCSQAWKFKGETGLLYIFPSYIEHEVLEQRTDNERVSISFNFGLKVKQQIKYDCFNFGPLLLKTHVDIDMCNNILEIAQHAKDDHRDGLASLIDNAKRFTVQDKNKIFQMLYPYFMCFIDLQDNQLINSIRPQKLELGDLWINYQKAGEFNPPHTHSMDLSFVICLEMPTDIKEENKNFIGKSSGPGAIAFNYGEFDKRVMHTHHFLPTKGDMFLFPSILRHTVFPFTSNVTRISVSGNLGYAYD